MPYTLHIDQSEKEQYFLFYQRIKAKGVELKAELEKSCVLLNKEFQT